jgi:lipopolysaccharide/colanic/teichoic acid biosynthesis glycosyltransferase
MAGGIKRKRWKMSEEERMRLDNEYADQFNMILFFWYDIKLILRTIPALLKRIGLKLSLLYTNMKHIVYYLILTLTLFSVNITKSTIN